MTTSNEPATPKSQKLAEGLQPSPERLRLAFDLHDAGVDLVHQRLRREHPELDEEQILALLSAWLRREGEPADAPGRPRALPRKKA
jgi:hypothetical protein